MEELKTKTWCVTINETDDCPLPDNKELRIFFEEQCTEYVFQKERGLVSGRLHWQCAMKLRVRRRKTTILNSIKVKGFKPHQWQLEPMYGSWEEASAYCLKDDTRVEGELIYTNMLAYGGQDVAFLDKKESHFPWQKELFNIIFNDDVLLFKKPDDRKIYWFTDFGGNTGKSKFTKWICLRNSRAVKVPFGSASQLRSSIISMGPKRVYMLDIPRTIGQDDDMKAIYSLLEDLKNGFVVSSMYGKNAVLLMDPPHVVVFSNQFPEDKRMSADRWVTYGIHKDNTVELCNTRETRLYYEYLFTND